ncbi:hypothetical protein [Algicola sagamiensis]|uniref:hypothetical protein n=1 Tax=Algicola sagamiensis TaxID=163869 RepID=UPI00036A884A|nr:hypothetical protein [Algicola sagamiensis]
MHNDLCTQTFAHGNSKLTATFWFTNDEIEMHDVLFENGVSISECELLGPLTDEILESAYNIITERKEQYRSGQLRHGA